MRAPRPVGFRPTLAAAFGPAELPALMSLSTDLPPPYPFYLVGIGASAGGLEALESFFENTTEDSGLAYVVIQHLSPDFKSLMDELLARRTRLPIHRVEDGMEVRPDAIFLIPPKKELILRGRQLCLIERDPNKSLALPIDTFFRSLAREAGNRAIAVVLSGTGSDGSRGLREIHAAGGMVLVQTPETAKFDGMPHSALETGVVDYTLPADEMPDVLQRYAHRSPDSDLSRLVGEPVISRNDLGVAFELLHREFGIDFSLYKPGTVARRIERRIEIARVGSLGDYVRLLKEDSAELNQLYYDLLIGVTRFFRDSEAFAILEREVLPALIDRLAPEEELRAWVAGCATGEEAYSLAMLIHEQLAARGRPQMFKIFATDVHPASLDVASAGVYDQSGLSGISQSRLERYFVPRGKIFQVSQDLRSRIVFSRHNLIKDAPFTRLDLISCRNLLIYFQTFAQRKALSLFHFGLKVGGVLTLGPSESTGDFAEEFEVVEPHWKLFRKRRGIRLRPEVQPSPLAGALGTTGPSQGRLSARAGEPNIPLMGIYDALLSMFMPPAILVNERREVIHCFAGAGKILEQRDGRFSPDVLDMVDERLRVPLAAALHRVAKTDELVSYSGVPTTFEGEERRVELTVRPFLDQRSHIRFHLVTIREETSPQSQLIEPKLTAVEAAHESIPVDMNQMSGLRLRELEQELQYTRESLQTTIEELETSNEELQATNEELISSNEELQSTNEELHSVNEELYTVNAEHQKKIDELTELTHDLDNLFVCSDIGIIFVDRDLRIRKFTPRIADQFALIPQDAGRRIDCFAHNLADTPLVAIVEEVLRNATPQEREVRDLTGRWLLLRVLPYLSDGRVDGAVVSLVDISRMKEVQEERAAQAAKLEAVNRELHETIAARERAEAEARDAVRRRDRFLAMLSHELRNPLNAIVLAAELHDRPDAQPDEIADAWRIFQRQSTHLGRLLDDLLDIARLDHDKVTLHCEPTNLARVAAEALNVVRPLASSKQIALRAEVETRPQWVEGDPARLQQILVNLLNNAVKYTPNGGNVGLTIRNGDDAVIIRVWDDGKGIPPEIIPRIFDLFFQHDDDEPRNPNDSSMGIGLSLVKRLVDLHRGTITARSDGPGQGAVFEIRLPRRHEPDVCSLPLPASRTVQPTGQRVVVIEDNPDTRRMLQLVLRREGYHVAAASDGEEGLSLVRSFRPAIALVDIGLPRIDGCEVARQIRSDPQLRNTLLVAVTGYGQSSDRELILAAGFDENLVKPVRVRDIVAFLANRLRPAEPARSPNGASQDKGEGGGKNEISDEDSGSTTNPFSAQ
jgi:two-component system CheB/CheR fusion protein